MHSKDPWSENYIGMKEFAIAYIYVSLPTIRFYHSLQSSSIDALDSHVVCCIVL